MKRIGLLLFSLTMVLAAAVGTENAFEKEKVSVVYVDQGNEDGYAVNVAVVNVQMDVAETGETIADFAPVEIWTDVVSTVDTKPPIATDTKVFNLLKGSTYTRYSWA